MKLTSSELIMIWNNSFILFDQEYIGWKSQHKALVLRITNLSAAGQGRLLRRLTAVDHNHNRIEYIYIYINFK